MRQGFDPKLLLDKKGAIFAIATGSDACAEHECGSSPLQEALCAGYVGKDSPVKASLIKQLRQADQPDLRDRLQPQKAVQFPDLLSQKVINRNLDKIQFVQGIDERAQQPAALLCFTTRYRAPDLNDTELAIWNKTVSVAGAWDENGFAFKVVGAKLVAKLQTFAEKLQAGQGCFAGLFLDDEKDDRLSGVILALHTGLRPEHKAALDKAQRDYESNLLLEARSRVDELHAMAYSAAPRQPHLCMPGYVWPVWKDGVVGGDVLYALNPNYGVEAPYWGPYAFEQLADWIVATKKFALKPVPRTKAVSA